MKRLTTTLLSALVALVGLACHDTSSSAKPAVPSPPAPAPAALSPGLDQLAQEGWYGIYMMGNKVGHAHLWMRKSRGDEPGAFAYGFAMHMSVSGGGQSNQLVMEEERFYGPVAPHPLIESRFRTGAKGFMEERVARAVGDKLRVTRTSPGEKASSPRDIPGSKEDLLSQLAIAPLTLDPTDVGKAKKLDVFSWEKEADEAISVVLERIEERQRAGVKERVGHLAMTYVDTGVTGKVIVAEGGQTLEMTLGASLLLKLEERSVAESGVSGLDILGTGIASPAKLGVPTRVDRLTLEVTGPAGLTLAPSSVRQVEALPAADASRGRWRITLSRGKGDVVAATDRAAALVGDSALDIEHPSIKARAEELTRGLATRDERIRAIADFVYRTLDKKLATHLPTASTILDKKVGDCTEHTWLTTALLRAAGIPARPVYGVAYTGDGESLFAYHAWVEVAVEDGQGERWLMIDPTWGEAEADATHIALGRSLGEVAGSIGGLVIDKAEVLPR